ncbi:MAG TPA: hypothetical protein VGK99_08630 [Acidobacteriota bacterium]|jgi:hypothetical protein
MGKPLMLREQDINRIETLKRRLDIGTKVDVVRAGLDLLEQEADRRRRIARWRSAARIASQSSREVNAEFRKFSRMKKG